MSELTIVIPHWNRRELLARLLERLRAQTHAASEIIVVDNGSQDGSVEMAQKAGVRVIALERNLRFAAAVNRGICESRTEWVAVLNNDVEPACDWAEHLTAAVSQPGVWFATGKLLSAGRPGVLDGAWDSLCRGACAWHTGHDCIDGPAWSRERAIFFAPFAAAVFRKELFDRAGLLDETFEFSLEDVDFCLRCAALGYFGRYVPQAVATHLGSATLGAWNPYTVRRVARNQVLLVAKHYRARHLLRFAWPILVAQGLWGLVALRHGRGVAYTRGKLEGLAMFRRTRRRERLSGRIAPDIEKVLHESESDILRLQRETGFDLYWRIYFALVGRL